jgi:hypothetical protein
LQELWNAVEVAERLRHEQGRKQEQELLLLLLEERKKDLKCESLLLQDNFIQEMLRA